MPLYYFHLSTPIYFGADARHNITKRPCAQLIDQPAPYWIAFPTGGKACTTETFKTIFTETLA